MVASAFLFAAMAALLKAAARGVPTPQVVFVRNLAHALLFVPLWWFRSDRRVRAPRLLVLRAVLGLLALEAYAWTLSVLPLADAWILQATNPLFVSLLAPVLLGERAPGRTWLSLALGLGGAFLVVRPGLAISWVPGVVGILGAVCSGLAYLTVRRLGRTESALAIVAAFPLVAGPLSLPFAIAVWTWPTALEWAALLGAAAAAAGGQVLMTIGLRAALAAPATIATYSGFAFAAAIGWLAFGEPLSLRTAAGTLVIFAGVALLGRRAAPPARPSGTPVAPPPPPEVA
jgi:drug/metabolite transporter (DMT)-like permease